MHINAPINVTGSGTRWSQCAKCRKVFGLSEGFVEGSHLCCGDCGQNLLLKKMSMVEWEALTEQYTQPPSPVMTTIKPSLLAQWECPAVRDSTEADAAQDLVITHGVPVGSLIANVGYGTSLTVALRKMDTAMRCAPRNTVSLTSPLAIQMLMHFYGTRERFIPAPVSFWPPAQRGIVEGFKAAGLIFERDHEDFGTTDKGSLIVETLKATFKEVLRNV